MVIITFHDNYNYDGVSIMGGNKIIQEVRDYCLLCWAPTQRTQEQGEKGVV